MINHYERIDGGNFGDDLNETMWNKLLPKPLSEYLDNDTFFIGIGTRLRPKNIPKGKRIIVFGAGFGYSDFPPTVNQNWDIRCLRGPLTADALGVDRNKVITDAAILCKDLYQKGIPRYDVSFIPHHLTSAEDNWEKVCKELNINFINPKQNPDFVIDDLTNSKLIIAESLHGAIIADTFRVPWIPVKIKGHFSQFKWNDWMQSMNLEVKIEHLSSIYDRGVLNKKSKLKWMLKTIYGVLFGSKIGIYQLRKLINQKGFLSEKSIMESKHREMVICLNNFIQDLEK